MTLRWLYPYHCDYEKHPSCRKRALATDPDRNPLCAGRSQKEAAFVPDEIHLITTAEGANRAALLLLSERPGWYRRLCREYHLPEGGFGRDSIHVIPDRSGCPMHDIRTPEDNAAAADFIVAQVRKLTANPACRVHASIAGGRKTMGFYLGYAMSLFGRAQDELSHVLVSEPFESLPDFFFPTISREIIYSRDGKPLDASQAQVWLAAIPFVRMRQGIPQALQQGDASFSDIVQAASQAFDAPQLLVDTSLLRLDTSIGLVSLPPAEFVLALD